MVDSFYKWTVPLDSSSNVENAFDKVECGRETGPSKTMVSWSK